MTEAGGIWGRSGSWLVFRGTTPKPKTTRNNDSSGKSCKLEGKRPSPNNPETSEASKLTGMAGRKEQSEEFNMNSG
jgi:hypothetical protein